MYRIAVFGEIESNRNDHICYWKRICIYFMQLFYQIILELMV